MSKRLSPFDYYQGQVSQGIIKQDDGQMPALEALQLCYQQVLTGRQMESVYLHGPVGRGKTFLMQCFYQSLAPELVIRLHFHHFMAQVHQKLNQLQGQKNPLRTIAKDFARRAKVICFDEFFVSDIGDAMLLAGLLKALFEYRVSLICTSNSAIEKLYWQGLQRDNFLPAIKLLQQQMKVYPLNGEEDYRTSFSYGELSILQKGAIQNDQAGSAEKVLAHTPELKRALVQFGLAVQQKTNDKSLLVLGRNIPSYDFNQHAVWFSFSHICQGPRSQLDYIELAKRFKYWCLSDVPIMSGRAHERIKARGTEDGVALDLALDTKLINRQSLTQLHTGQREVILAPMDDAARRFIALIDELYEQKVKLILSSEHRVEDWYCEGSLLFAYRRAFSRLHEMASEGFA